jgi:hypothetical protein
VAPPDLLRRRLLAGAALAPLAACTTPAFLPPPAQPVPPPRVRIGDRWRYVETDRYNGRELGVLSARVEQVQPQLRVALAYADGRQRPDEVYAGAWNVVEEPAFDQLQRFDMPMPLIPPRIEISSWQTTRAPYHVPGSSGTFVWQQQVSSPGWERVRVPAGEFDCLRVDRRIFFVHSDFFRLESQRQDTLWYAPQVNRWVRREWTGWYLWPSGRRRTQVREDWIAWDLLDYTSAPVS